MIPVEFESADSTNFHLLKQGILLIWVQKSDTRRDCLTSPRIFLTAQIEKSVDERHSTAKL